MLPPRQFWNGGVDWQANFASGIPLSLNIKSAAADAALDLSQLTVTDLQLDLNAGNCTLITPTSAGATNVTLKANVANVTVDIPGGVAAKIRAKTSLAAFDVDASRFPRQGDYYVSANYDTAANRVLLDIESNVGRVAVK
ncbi:MAG: hypothetical protein Q8O05_08185 [Chloroflexota bacterium]|nr:hypothetical protein [Chloroflexota bacterium]